MKQYLSPEMKALIFISEEAIGAPLTAGPSGNDYNDGELEWNQTAE